MNNIFKNLVKLAYVNPKYRKELFVLLGVKHRTYIKTADDSAAVKIKDDAQKGVFSGYTLGVLSAYFTSQGRKFRNPNPEGGKDEIAISTLVKYYNEREKNPEYKKFETNTIRELQMAFDNFYRQYESQQKQKKELVDEDGQDEFAGMTDDEIAESLEVKQKESPAMKKMREKREQQRKEKIEKAKSGDIFTNVVKALDEIDPFRTMSSEDEAKEVEKLYSKWEEKLYEVKDGKVFLKTGLEDNDETRELVRSVLRDNLTDEKIDEIFNETGKHRKDNAVSKYLNKKMDSATKLLIKSQTEFYEKNSNLIIKGLSLANKGLKALGKEVDFNSPEAVQNFLNYIDEKYNKEMNPEMRTAMRKNSKAIIAMLKEYSDKTGASSLAQDIKEKVVSKVQDSENIQNVLSKTKEYTHNLYDKVIKKDMLSLEDNVKKSLVKKTATKISDSIGDMSATLTGMDSKVIGASILNGDSDGLKKVLVEKGIELKKETLGALIQGIRDDIDTFKTQGTADALEKINEQIQNIKMDNISFEDSLLSKAGSIADVASMADNVYNHTASKVVRTFVNVLEIDIQGIKDVWKDSFTESVKKNIANSISTKLQEQGLLAKDKFLTADEVTGDLGIEKWMEGAQKKIDEKLDTTTTSILTKLNSYKDIADKKLEALETPEIFNEKIQSGIEKSTQSLSESINSLKDNVKGEAKEQLTNLSKNIVEINKKVQDSLSEGYTGAFKEVHKQVEELKNEYNSILSGVQEDNQEYQMQLNAVNKAFSFITDKVKENASLFGTDSETIDNIVDVGNTLKYAMRDKIADSLNDKVSLLENSVDKFATEQIESNAELLSSLGAGLGSALGYPLDIVSKVALNKFTNNTFYKEIEKEGGAEAVMIQKMLNHAILPQEVDDDFRTRAKNINSANHTAEYKVKLLTELQQEYETKAKPAIARALYLLGKRDATGADIEGFFKQKLEYLKRGSEDDSIDFSTFYVRLSSEDIIPSDKEKAEILKNFLKNKKNKDEIPIDVLIHIELNKNNFVNDLKQGVKKITSGGDIEDMMKVMTGKKGVSIETYSKSKETHLNNIKNKKKKKPKSK